MKKKKLIIALSIIPAFLFVKLASLNSRFVEDYYSEGLYPLISKASRYTFGWIPFSIGDVFYTAVGIIAIRWFINNRKRIFKDTKNWLIDILTVTSIGYIAFHFFWGFNYYRSPVHEKLDIGYKYSTEDLITTTTYLIEKTNEIHSKLSANDSVKITMPYSKNELISKSNNGFEHLKTIHPSFDFQPQSSKRSLYSLPLTYMGFSGYLNPFTNEAQIDGLIPLYQYPFTVCHEQAHQLGYAAENEANFIGYLGAILNEDDYIKYSGYASALRYCLSEVGRRDKEAYQTLYNKMNKGILKNYQESYEFWTQYENPLEPFFKTFYNGFLKANSQDKGIESYSYVVALIVNFYQNTELQETLKKD